MNKQVYFCTSQQFHPTQDPFPPLCLVWIAVKGHYDKVRSKVYKSNDFVQMMNLARELATEKQIGLTVLSTNIEPEVIYQLNESTV
ncbi:MAG: hypothetical protein WCW62_12590 [Bacteroidales bacterium]|jgi:hypothetical protein